jgi:hypothetical protein
MVSIVGMQTMKQLNIFKKSTIKGGLWGDFIAIYWIFEYFHHSIHVWNMVSIKSKIASTPLNLVYGNSHFEPITIYS